MSNDLTTFWIRADLEDPVFTGDEVRRFPATVRRLLESRRLIRQAENLRVIECDACGEGHLEEVEILTEPAGSRPRAYIMCPEAGRVSVDPQRLQQWSVDLDAVGRTVVASLDLCDRIVSITPGRVWLLGARKFNERTRDVFLVRGITWPDTRQILESAARLASSPCPVILCLNRFPDNPEWQNRERVVFSLAEPSWLGGEQIVLLDRITAVLRENSPRGAYPLPSAPVMKATNGSASGEMGGDVEPNLATLLEAHTFSDQRLRKIYEAVVRYDWYLKELRALKVATKKYRTPELLKKEFPKFEVWAVLDDHDGRDIANGDFLPGRFAWALIKRSNNLSGKDDRTLKNYRKALRRAGIAV